MMHLSINNLWKPRSFITTLVSGLIANWIDATQGWLRKGISRSAVVNVQLAFPKCGFHQSLLRLAKDYSGSTIVGGVKVMRGIVK